MIRPVVLYKKQQSSQTVFSHRGLMRQYVEVWCCSSVHWFVIYDISSYQLTLGTRWGYKRELWARCYRDFWNLTCIYWDTFVPDRVAVLLWASRILRLYLSHSSQFVASGFKKRRCVIPTLYLKLESEVN